MSVSFNEFRGKTFVFNNRERWKEIEYALSVGGLTIAESGWRETDDNKLNIEWFIKVSNKRSTLRSRPKSRINRTTGVEVTVGHAHDLGLEYEQGEIHWYSVCETHHYLVGHRTKQNAEAFASEPWSFCEQCEEMI